MDTCKYEDENTETQDDRLKGFASTWRLLLRQVFISSGVCSIYFVLGLSFGAPTVFIPQIRGETNSTIFISDDMASWLSSVHGYSALPWIPIVPVMAERLGRKLPFIFVCINTLIGFIVFYCSTSATQLLISEIMQGMLLASNITLYIPILVEYTSTQYRGVILAFEAVVFFLGMWVANLMGTLTHWRNIAILAFLCSLYSLTAFVWPESPSWLAMKGRFDECAAFHHWLKGFDKDSENELVNLINSQKEYLKACAERKNSSSRLKNFTSTVTSKGFYKPLLLCITIVSLYHFSGKFVCSMYAVDLIKHITNSESAAYIGMLILDGITIAGMLTGCVLSKFLKRRSLLIYSSMLAIVFLFTISLYFFIISLNVVAENKFVSVLILTSFSVCISCGPLILPGCVFGEVLFLRYKSSSSLVLTLYSELLMATVLKLSPYMFEAFTLQGAFLFYGVSASVFTIILCKYLPETKDKTVAELEAYFEEPTKFEDVSKVLIDENNPHNESSDGHVIIDFVA